MRKRNSVTLDSSLPIQSMIKHKLGFKITETLHTSVIILGKINIEFYAQTNTKPIYIFHWLVPLLNTQLNTHTKQKESWRQWCTEIYRTNSTCNHVSYFASQVYVFPYLSVLQTLPTPSYFESFSPCVKVWDCVYMYYQASVLFNNIAICFGGVGT